jgi:tetratricopeptide (TPR) repeat protein
MRRLFPGVLILTLATLASGMVFERFLSPNQPKDRAIMDYMALEQAGKATSTDLANLGVLILEKGFPNDAEHYLREALKLDEDNYEAAYRLGLVLQRQGHDFKAARYYKKVLKARPGYAEARFMLALAEERCGLRDAAIGDYVKAYRHAPDLANPDINPLVYDSHLQTEVGLMYYRETVKASTLKVTPIDPAAVRQMMQVNAARAGTPVPEPVPQASPEPAAQPTVQPQPAAQPQPTPQARPVTMRRPPTPQPETVPGGLVPNPPATPTPQP